MSSSPATRKQVEQRLFGSVFDPFEDTAEFGVNLIESGADLATDVVDIAFDASESAVKTTLKEIKSAMENIAKEGTKTALDVFPDTSDIVAQLNSLTDIDNWTPKSISDGLIELTITTIKDIGKKVEEGYAIVKKVVEQIIKLLEWLLIALARKYAKDLQDFTVAVVSLFKENLNDIKNGIIDRDPGKIIKGITRLITTNTPFKAIIENLESRSPGSFIFTVDGAKAAGVGVNQSVGIAINIDALIYLIKNGTLDDFEGAALSFFSSSGVSLFSFGGGVDMTIGYDVDAPDDIDGLGLDVTLSLDAKVGGSVAVGLDPFASFPPSLTSIAVGLGGGASVEASVGGSYTKLIGVYEPSKAASRLAPNGVTKLRSGQKSSSAQRSSPTRHFLNMAGNPKLVWYQYNWGQLPPSAKENWQKLAPTLNSRSTNIPTSVFKNAWQTLTVDQKKAAGSLGFSQSSWDDKYPNGVDAANAPSSDKDKFLSSVTRYWCKYDWDSIGRHEQKLLSVLGWNRSKLNRFNASPHAGIVLRKSNPNKPYWTCNEVPPSYYKLWNQLSVRERVAATQLGYKTGTWIKLNPATQNSQGSNLAFVPFSKTSKASGHQFMTQVSRYSMTGTPTPGGHARYTPYKLVEETFDSSPHKNDSEQRVKWQPFGSPRVFIFGSASLAESRDQTQFWPVPIVGEFALKGGAIVDHMRIGKQRFGGKGGGSENFITLADGEYIDFFHAELSSGFKAGQIAYIKVKTNRGQTLKGGSSDSGNIKINAKGMVAAIGGMHEKYLSQLYIVMESGTVKMV